MKCGENWQNFDRNCKKILKLGKRQSNLENFGPKNITIRDTKKVSVWMK